MPSRFKQRRGPLRKKRKLLLEGLENRRLLAGDVTADFDSTTGVLTITGDNSGNGVELTPGDNPGEYRVIGADANGAMTHVTGSGIFVDAPITSIEVNLAGGSDAFAIRGNSPTDQFDVTAPVTIDDPTGRNTFSVINTRVIGALTVNGGADEDNVSIDGSTIMGPTTVSLGEGNNTVLIVNNSIFDGTLNVTTGADADSVFIFEAEIDGEATIDTGDGNNKVVFGMTATPVFGGKTVINQGKGNDRVIVHDAELEQAVFIANGDGSNSVTIEQSEIGVAVIGLVLSVSNGAGHDTLDITDSLVADDIFVSNGGGLAGSETTITNSTLGGEFDFHGDSGVDEISFTDVFIVNNVNLELFDGQNFVTFVRTDLGDDLSIDGGMHRDHVIISATIIKNDIAIDLLDGRDTLEILAGSELRGVSSLKGGDGPNDTFIRELTPELVDIAFLELESFEEHLFVID